MWRMIFVPTYEFRTMGNMCKSKNIIQLFPKGKKTFSTKATRVGHMWHTSVTYDFFFPFHFDSVASVGSDHRRSFGTQEFHGNVYGRLITILIHGATAIVHFGFVWYESWVNIPHNHKNLGLIIGESFFLRKYIIGESIVHIRRAYCFPKTKVSNNTTFAIRSIRWVT